MNEVKIKTVEDLDVSLVDSDIEELVITPDTNVGPTAAISMVTRSKAYELYMDNTPYDTICKALDIKKATLASWVTRHNWAEIRKQNSDLIVKENLESKKALLSGLTLEILDNCLKSVRNAGGPNGFKAKDLPTFLSAVASLEKLSRLSLGLATSISEERSKRANFTLPIEHLRNVSQVKIADPFAEAPKDEPSGTTENT